MNISNLDEHFNIAEYEPDKAGRATIELINGDVRVRIPYQFHSDDGSVSPMVNVDAEATEQQLSDLKSILAEILQATNAAIESEHGWMKYIKPDDD